MKNDKKILLTILSVQTAPDGERNEMELVTEGILRPIEGGTSLSYQESEIVGTDGATMTIELLGETVKVIRSGEYSTNFEFRRGQKCLSLYATPFGTMEMGAYPIDVRYGIQECTGELELQYELDVQGQPVGRNHLRMKWREEGCSPIC